MIAIATAPPVAPARIAINDRSFIMLGLPPSVAGAMTMFPAPIWLLPPEQRNEYAMQATRPGALVR